MRNNANEVVYECSVKISVDSNTSTVAIMEEKKVTVAKVFERYMFAFQVIVVVLVIICVLLFGVYYETILQLYCHHRDSIWLQDFYMKNAPEKLEKDPKLVENLMKKHSKHMFVLWRNLEKSYGIKWSPPYSVADTTEF